MPQRTVGTKVYRQVPRLGSLHIFPEKLIIKTLLVSLETLLENFPRIIAQ